MDKFQKSQTIRLIDMVAIAPFLIYVSTKSNITKLDKNLLLILGILTFTYNANNYFKNKLA